LFSTADVNITHFPIDWPDEVGKESNSMKLARVGDYQVSGFAFAGGWRLHVRRSTWTAEQNYWFVRGKFYQYDADVEAKVMNEIGFSQIVEVSPPPGAVEAMQAAVIQWHYEEPKSGRA
jgi:hypothetical protein